MKILVNVRIPSISQEYDVFIPSSLRIKRVIPLLAKTVEDLSNHIYVSSGNESLCSVEKNMLLREHETFKSYGIQNGEHLMLM